MENKLEKEGNKLANEHWEYVGKLCEKMYKDAFIHGYKHGRNVDEKIIFKLLKRIK